jgi:monofunctional biosynthetic peptidoglycan transglycosylase
MREATSQCRLSDRHISLLLVLVTLAFAAIPSNAAAILRLPDVKVLAKKNPSTSALIQSRIAQARREGVVVRPQRIWVPLSRISPHLQRAVIIAEDASFYDHGGFDWGGIREAAQRDLQNGKLTHGGSTITQQVAKNLYLSGEKTLVRKANEAIITLALEQHLTKQRILELYLNFAEWGHGIFGAEAAARHHFQKPASALTKEEAALLAAILPSPLKNDPLQITPYLEKRQRWILSWMDKKDASADERRGTSARP